VQRVLGTRSYRERAQALQAELKDWQGATLAAQYLTEFAGG